MIYQIAQFAGTACEAPNQIYINSNQQFVLSDHTSSILKPGESYLVTISKIASPQIIIEETTDEQKETTQEIQEMA